MFIFSNYRKAIFSAIAVFMLLVLAVSNSFISSASADSSGLVQAEPSPTKSYQPIVQPQMVHAPRVSIPAQVIIQFAPGATAKERATYIKSIGGTLVKKIDSLDTVIVKLSKEVAQAPLPASPIIAETEPDYYASALEDMPPNDPLYSEQWALPAIGAPLAWAELPAETPKVTIAVIDSGICASHSDLAGRIVDGWDFLESDTVPQDDFGHGCAVSGVIAANMNDGIGIAGIAPNAMIMPLRVLNSSGIGSYSDVAAAIVYAADHGAQVINLSLGGTNPSSILENAVYYAISKGAIVVAAAGNNGIQGALYPAAYPDVIAVGAVDPDLQHSSFSNYGSQIDIWAPGRDILTTKRDGSYGLVSGTSFAAPYVAGAEAIETSLNRALILDGSLLGLGAQVDISTPTETLSPTTMPAESPIVSVTPTGITRGFYSERSGDYSFDYPIDWKLIDDKYWQDNDPLTFDSFVELKTPDNEVLTIRRWANIEHLPIDELSTKYLYFTLEGTARPYGEGLINPNPMVMAIEPGKENERPTTFSALVECGTSVYNFRYFGYNAGSNVQAFRELLGSFNCANGIDGSVDSIPEITSSQFVKPPSILEGSGVTCHGFYDPTSNRYSCGQCTWWASYSRPDIPDTYEKWPGDAYQWYNNAVQDPNFDVSSSPEAGAIAVWKSNTGGTGVEGHVAYVTGVNTNGTFNVTEMNWACPTGPGTCTAAPRNSIPDTENINFILGGVTFFEHQDFAGQWQRARTNVDIFANSWGVSSVFIPANWEVFLYKYPFLDTSVSRERTGAQTVWALNSSFWNLQLDSYSDGSIINDNVRSARVINNTINQCVNSTGESNSLGCGEPTPTPAPTQPTPTLPPPSDGIEIISVSSHVVRPGEQFNPSITIKHVSGELVANRDHLHAVPEDASNLFGAGPVQPLKSNVPIGGTYTFDVNNDSGFRMTAPSTPGQYQSVWQMRVNGVHVGPQAVINIIVQSDPIVTPPPPPPIDCNNPPEGITLYEFTDFRGRCINFTSDVMYLGNTYFGDNVASSLRVVGNWGVTFFQDPDWTGTWQQFSSNDNNLSDNQIGDNTVSSLRVWKPGDPCATLPQGVTLYRGRDFTGISQTFSNDAQFLGNETIGDNTVNALQICGPYRVTLYRDPDWTGFSEDFTGSDSNLTDDPINNPNPTASSLRIVDIHDACNSLPSGVTLYSETNFGGRSQTFSSDVMYLGNTSFGDNAAKSLRVCGHWTVTLSRDPDWNGSWENFTGSDNNLSDNPTGLNNASSIRMVDSYDFCRTLGPGVTLYRGRDFTGIAQTFTGDASFLGNGPIGNDTVTSIRQCGYNSRLYRDPDWQGFSEEFTGREESNLTDNQINTTSSSLRVWTITIPPTSTLTPSPTPIPAKPDLVPYDGNGWAFPLIPSSMPGDHWVGTLYAGQITYLDWGIFNNSSVNVTAPFKVKLFLDGTQIDEISYTSLDANSYHGIDDWNIYVGTPGYHVLKISVDSNNQIIETNENNNSWEGSFYWNPISANCPTITDWKGEYWNNPSLAGSPALCRNDPDLNFDWGLGSPDPLISDDNFSARWTKTSNFSGGTYRFHLRHDDGARLYIDNAIKLDVWGTCCVWDTVDVPLQAGLHTVRVEFHEDGGAAHVQLWSEQISQQATTFGDVEANYWAWNFIERLYAAGITGGCGVNPPQYCPEGTVTRAQMAVFLERGIHGSSHNPPAVGGSTGFSDVSSGYWAAAWVKQLAAEGITGGCGSGNYCPDAPVTRAQMAIFLLRSKYGASYSPPAVGDSTGFSDVSTGYWAGAWIKQLVMEGITAGCGVGTYCPESPVTRAQMAVFLVRTFNLP